MINNYTQTKVNSENFILQILFPLTDITKNKKRTQKYANTQMHKYKVLKRPIHCTEEVQTEFLQYCAISRSHFLHYPTLLNCIMVKRRILTKYIANTDSFFVDGSEVLAKSDGKPVENLDRSQSVFYFVPQEIHTVTHSQAGSTKRISAMDTKLIMESLLSYV